MNNNIILELNETNNLLNYWYNKLGSKWYQEIIFLSFLPFGIIGMLFNILTLFILNSNQFKISFYTFLRAYTINSTLICFICATRFISNTRRFFTFSNTIAANLYTCYFFLPLVAYTNFFSSATEILLALERITLLSNKILWFKKIKPKILCYIICIFALFISIPYYLNFKPLKKVIYLNETEIFIINYYLSSESPYIIRKYLDVQSYLVELTHIILSTTLNIIIIYFIKVYNKRKKRLIAFKQNRIDNLNRNNQINVNKVKETFQKRKLDLMEIKLATLSILLGTISTM